MIETYLLITAAVSDCALFMLKLTMKSLAVVLMLCLPALAYANPSIVFESEMHDFGHVTQGELLEYSFEFTNTGTEELVIEKIESS
jgi:hypothetical protein